MPSLKCSGFKYGYIVFSVYCVLLRKYNALISASVHNSKSPSTLLSKTLPLKRWTWLLEGTCRTITCTNSSVVLDGMLTISGCNKKDGLSTWPLLLMFARFLHIWSIDLGLTPLSIVPSSIASSTITPPSRFKNAHIDSNKLLGNSLQASLYSNVRFSRPRTIDFNSCSTILHLL